MQERDVYDFFRRILARFAKPKPDPSVIHVSEVVGCLRRSFYNRRIVSHDFRHIGDHEVVKRAIGLIMHDAMASQLKDLGNDSEVSVAVDLGDFKLVGRADAIVDDSVVEFKFVSKLPDRPHEEHLLQVNAYMYMLKLNKGYIVYVDRNTGRVRVFQVSFSPRLWRKVVERAKQLHRYLVEGRIPPRERGPWCHGCEWYWFCLK